MAGSGATAAPALIDPAQANPERIRTAELGNRDDRRLWRLPRPEFSVSGSDSEAPLRQDPAESRYFLGLLHGVREAAE